MFEREGLNYVKVPSEDWLEKIQILISENDILVDESKTRAKGIEQLSAIIEQQGEEISNEETARLETDLQQSREALQTEKARFDALKAALNEVTEKYHEHMEESEVGAARERELIGAIRILEVENEDLNAVLTDTKSESQSLANEIISLQALSQNLEKKIQELQESESELIPKLELAVGKTEEAFLERDKAILREQQALDEIKRLNEKYNETAQKWKLKAETEIANMRAQHLQDKKKAGDEIAKLEAKVSHSHSQAERSIREKRAAESELEKMMKHIPDEVERLNGIIEEVAGRLRSAEREKSDNLEALGSLQQKLSRDQNRYEKEKEELVFQVDDFYRRLRRAEKDLEDSKESTVKLMNQVTQLEHENDKLKDAKIKMLIQKDSELHGQQVKHETETSELKSKLSAVTAAHSKTCQELQHTISNQHDVAARWKSESNSLVTRYESVITELRGQIARCQERIKELETEIQDSAQSRKELALEVEAERRNTQKSKLLLRSTEDKCDSLTRKIDVLLKNEHDAVVEKKHLQRQIDRMHMERERLERERSYKENREMGVVRQTGRSTKYETSVADSESQQDLRTLQAEIERVKNRSRSAHHNIDVFLNTLDDENDLLSD
ncbi:UNVERIFIED_CONTAM: hypothetical protein HDU68_010500 [Siphonaria sp. JEL0065]|nr:hypothetical protein HDU68_010500 [Siphonaria sp. JEL0065]